MRGLPACGKSHRARQLAGPDGVVLETDQYFYTEVGFDRRKYDYDTALLPAARQWNFDRFCRAIAEDVSPIVVDRGNGLNAETKRYAVHAATHGYLAELSEPDSSWWHELRVLLKYREYVDDRLFDAWAEQLADATKETHRVPSATIRHWMARWRHDLTMEEILEFEESVVTQD
ncbi:MAG: AAA family ATPase [Rubripirellula sp.]